MVSALIPGSKRSGFEPWGLLLEGPAKFSHPESRGIISNLTELFYLHILSITRSSFHTTIFRTIHRSVFRYRFAKNVFTCPKRLRGFRETCPWSGTLCCVLEQGTLLSQCLSPPRLVNCWGNQLNKLHGSDLRWSSIPSRGSRNTPSGFMLQKPG